MKKQFVFFIFIIFTSSVVAQKKPVTQGTGICNTIKKVQENSKDNFYKIRDYFEESIVDNIHGYLVEDGYKTTAKFPGANASYVSSKIIPGEYIDAEKNYHKYDYAYVAYWGKFKTSAAASQKLEQLKKQISACLPGYRVKESSEIRLINSILKRYEYIDTSFYALLFDTAPVRIYLQLELYNPYKYDYNFGTGEPCIFFRIEPGKPGTELETLLKIWENDDGKVDQNKLAKQLNQLFDYAKDGFKVIKGEKIVDQSSKELKEQLANFYFDKKIYSKFKTSFLPEIADRSEIRDYPDDRSTKFIASYDYYISAALTFQWLFEKLKRELGSDFIYEADEGDIKMMDSDKGQKAVFYRKISKQPRIELIFNMDADTITNGMPPGILIVVEAPNSQSNITYAEGNKFNEQLSSIVADYASNFETIKGERKTAWGDGDKFYSKVELQGADSVYLVQNWTTRRLSFIAIYSKHSSKEEAREKFNELVAQVGQCKFPCCTFAKTDVSELSNMVVQAWLPFDLYRKMEPAYKDILLEVEIGKRIDLVTKSGKFDMEESWQLVLRVKKL